MAYSEHRWTRTIFPLYLMTDPEDLTQVFVLFSYLQCGHTFAFWKMQQKLFLPVWSPKNGCIFALNNGAFLLLCDQAIIMLQNIFNSKYKVGRIVQTLSLIDRVCPLLCTPSKGRVWLLSCVSTRNQRSFSVNKKPKKILESWGIHWNAVIWNFLGHLELQLHLEKQLLFISCTERPIYLWVRRTRSEHTSETIGQTNRRS